VTARARMCRCGHTAHWHGIFGCESTHACHCKRFVLKASGARGAHVHEHATPGAFKTIRKNVKLAVGCVLMWSVVAVAHVVLFGMKLWRRFR
jgi:hypothetical protein